jgi:cytochrome c oxidase subunit 4
MSSETREIMHDQHSHPVHGTRTYWIIGAILFVVTALEIFAYYMEERLGPAVVPVILTLSAAKFLLVAMFFMHLKYDSKVFTGIFLFPLALAGLVIVGLIMLYHVLHPLR